MHTRKALANRFLLNELSIELLLSVVVAKDGEQSLQPKR
jgi:hypothetical protein